jgi:hypothetical protein
MKKKEQALHINEVDLRRTQAKELNQQVDVLKGYIH